MRVPSWACAVVVLGVGSGCVTAGAPPTSAAGGAGVPRVRVSPYCVGSPQILLVHTIIESEVRYDGRTAGKRGKRTERERTLWHMECRPDAWKCVGAIAPLGAWETGREINLSEFELVLNMQATARTDRTFTLSAPQEHELPPGFKPEVRTLTVDLDARRVDFYRSWGDNEARGSGACGPARTPGG
jgi:hypothetical protein